MKKKYMKPQIEVFKSLISTTLLAGSVTGGSVGTDAIGYGGDTATSDDYDW